MTPNPLEGLTQPPSPPSPEIWGGTGRYHGGPSQELEPGPSLHHSHCAPVHTYAYRHKMWSKVEM